MLCQFLFINSLQLLHPLRSEDVLNLLRPERFSHYWRRVSTLLCTRKIRRHVWRYSLQLILITTEFLSEVHGRSVGTFQAPWSIFYTFWGYRPRSGLWSADSCSLSEVAVTVFRVYILRGSHRTSPAQSLKIHSVEDLHETRSWLSQELITIQTSVIVTWVQQTCCLY
jgi:hypothetical protein